MQSNIVTLFVAAICCASASGADVRLRLQPTKVSVRVGQELRVRATVTNTGTEPVTLVLPGDGSDTGLRSPFVGWSFLPSDSDAPHPTKPPPAVNRGFGDINPLRRRDVFTLRPGESRSLGKWIGWPTKRPVGRYRAVLYYVNDPAQPVSGEPLSPHEPGVEALIRASTFCSLVSNEIIVDIIE